MDTREHNRPVEQPLSWEYDIPLLTNRFILWDAAKVFGISFVLTYVVVAAIGLIAGGELVLLPLELMAAILGILVLVFLFVMLVVYQNRFHSTFTVDADGARVQSGGTTRKVNTVLFTLGLLLGGWRSAGPVLLGRASETSAIAWEDGYTVVERRPQRVIELNNAWRTALRLYCPPELFDDVLARVQGYTSQARPAPLTEQLGTGVRGAVPFLGWAAPTLVAAFLATAWETDEVVPLIVSAAGALLVCGAASGMFRRAIALVAAGAAGLLLARIATLALQETKFAGGYIKIYGYEHDPEFLAIGVTGGVGLFVLALVHLVRTGRKRRS